MINETKRQLIRYAFYDQLALQTHFEKMAQKGFAAGYALDGNELLVCATEMRTEADLTAYTRALEGI